MLRKRNTLGTVLSKSQKLGVNISGCGFAVQSATSITVIYSAGAQLVAGHVGQGGKCPRKAMDLRPSDLERGQGMCCTAGSSVEVQPTEWIYWKLLVAFPLEGGQGEPSLRPVQMKYPIETLGCISGFVRAHFNICFLCVCFQGA